MNETLPVLTPDAARGTRTIARCHARLDTQRRKLEARARQPPRGAVVERLVLAGVCVAYLISMAGNLMRMALGALD